MSVPHGGTLVNRLVADQAREALLASELMAD